MRIITKDSRLFVCPYFYQPGCSLQFLKTTYVPLTVEATEYYIQRVLFTILICFSKWEIYRVAQKL